MNDLNDHVRLVLFKLKRADGPRESTMPTTRLVDTVTILAQITKLHKSVRFWAYTNKHIYSDSKIFEVELEYNDFEGIEAKTKGSANTFDEALQAAWTKLEMISKKGLGAHALAPPVEQRALPNGADEVTIPFTDGSR